MSRDPNDDAPLDAATLRALREHGELVPTSESEVERAEAGLSEDLELPESLKGYRPPRREPDKKVRRLPVGPRVVSHVVAGAFGAAAAAAAVLWLRPEPEPTVTGAGNELVPSPSSTASARVPLVFGNRCLGDCCAGSDCKNASGLLRSCPSGIRCASCTPDNVRGGPYRLRIGTVIVSEAGKKLLPADAPLELCVTASSSEKPCLPALSESRGEAFRALDVVSPLQDLLVGLTVELRKRGETTPLASWKHAVSPTADILCKGLAIQLSDGTETLGRLSAFVEPTHFVELSRAASAPELLKKLERFDVRGIEPRLYESSRPGSDRFVLSLGPFEKVDADALRWQVLDHGFEATVSHGLDFVGSPRPLR